MFPSRNISMGVSQWLVVLSLALLSSGLVRETGGRDEGEMRKIYLQKADEVHTRLFKIIFPPDVLKRVGKDLKELSMTQADRIYDLLLLNRGFEEKREFLNKAFIILTERFVNESKIFLIIKIILIIYY